MEEFDEVPWFGACSQCHGALSGEYAPCQTMDGRALCDECAGVIVNEREVG